MSIAGCGDASGELEVGFSLSAHYPRIQYSSARHCQLLLRYGTRKGLCAAATPSLVHLPPMSPHNGLFDPATARAKCDIRIYWYGALPLHLNNASPP